MVNRGEQGDARGYHPLGLGILGTSHLSFWEVQKALSTWAWHAQELSVNLLCLPAKLSLCTLVAAVTRHCVCCRPS